MRVISCILVEHNLWIVALSIATCVVGCSVTLPLWRRALVDEGHSRFAWCFLAAVTGGASIWATHFIAMLGYRPTAPVTFDAAMTVASALIVILGTGLGNAVASARQDAASTICGGGLVGLAIAAMHYVGMFAYRVDGIVTWSASYIVLSLLAVAGGSTLAVHFARRHARGSGRHAATAVLVAAIVALHFMGMAAFAVAPMPGLSVGADSDAFTAIAIAVALVALVMMGTGLSSNLIAERLSASSGQLERLNETLEARVAERTAALLEANARLARETAGRIKAQADLHQIQKLETIGQLTGGVAHDFNNLLTPIMGSLDIICRRVPIDERMGRLLCGAMESAERAKTLVARLLAFARRQTLESKPVDLSALVAGMTDLIERSLGPTITVIVEVPDDLPPAKVDPAQLELALLNLAVNARDAMPSGGSLTIAVRQEQVGEEDGCGIAPGRYLALSVADIGLGMDEATLSRAVEPFFSTKGVGQGTGLGLSMVHGLAAQSGGRLVLASQPGQGTTAAMWLPVADRVASPVVAAPAVEASSAWRAATVLLVDDEELVRASTAGMLRDLGYTVAEASGSLQALDLLRGGLVPDLMVTDYLMPGMNGVELTQEVRRGLPALPALLITGYAQLTENETGQLPRLAKPFRQADLAARLNELLTHGGAEVVHLDVRARPSAMK